MCVCRDEVIFLGGIGGMKRFLFFVGLSGRIVGEGGEETKRNEVKATGKKGKSLDEGNGGDLRRWVVEAQS